MTSKHVVALLVGLLLAGATGSVADELLVDLRAEAQDEIARAASVEVATRMIAGKGDAIHQSVEETTVTLTTGEATYSLQYACIADEQGRRLPMGAPLSEVGMITPSPANWYTGGFFDAIVDAMGLAQLPATVQPLELPAGSAGVRFTWPHPSGEVDLDLRVFAFDPVLYAVVDLPAGDARELKLLCYPNSFEVPRDRWVTTAARDVQHYDDLRETLEPDERAWVLYTDRAADPLLRPSTGPCALVLLPEQWASIELAMGAPVRPDWPVMQNYGVMTTLTPVPGERRLALALIDFLPITWTGARATLEEKYPEIQARLRDM